MRTPTIGEDQIEYVLRRFACPVCAATPDERCIDNGKRVPYAHTGRYRIAAEAGAVPAFGGRR